MRSVWGSSGWTRKISADKKVYLGSLRQFTIADFHGGCNQIAFARKRWTRT